MVRIDGGKRFAVQFNAEQADLFVASFQEP